jgi:hypothetical protein
MRARRLPVLGRTASGRVSNSRWPTKEHHSAPYRSMPIRRNATLIPWFLMGVVFAAAVASATVESDSARRQAVGICGLSLRIALLTSGYDPLKQGRRRGRLCPYDAARRR